MSGMQKTAGDVFSVGRPSILEATGKPAVARRAFDLFFATVGMLVFAPVFLLVPVFIFLEDRQAVFFRQDRLGAGKTLFRIFKFRTMRDGEVTSVGRWLRRCGLDEIPQFLNVLRGEMRMVGCRPLTTADVTRLDWTGPEMSWRWDDRPGITGLAQVLAGRSACHSRRLDALYMRRKGIVLDFQLIAISFVMNLVGKRRGQKVLRSIRRHLRETS